MRDPFPAFVFTIAMPPLVATALMVHWRVPEDPALSMMIFFVAAIGGAIVAVRYFSARDPRLPRGYKPPTLEELEAAGLIESTSFRATRAFAVEEYEDEGLHYFIEIDGGRVLFLSGQYLYYYAALDEDDMDDCPPRFPCTEFVIKRHKAERHVMDIACTGTLLPPEAIVPHASLSDWQYALDDGQIIEDRPYHAIKTQALNAPPPQRSGWW